MGPVTCWWSRKKMHTEGSAIQSMQQIDFLIHIYHSHGTRPCDPALYSHVYCLTHLLSKKVHKLFFQLSAWLNLESSGKEVLMIWVWSRLAWPVHMSLRNYHNQSIQYGVTIARSGHARLHKSRAATLSSDMHTWIHSLFPEEWMWM